MRAPDEDPGTDDAGDLPVRDLQAAARTGLASPTGLARAAWDPEPVDPPQVDRGLPGLPWPERSAESIRFATLSAEHWLSRRGVLREWVRLNLWAGVALLAFALLVVPPVTMLLEGTAQWSALVKTTALNVAAAAAGLPPVVIAVGAAVIAIKLLRRGWLRRRSQRRYQDGGDPYGMG